MIRKFALPVVIAMPLLLSVVGHTQGLDSDQEWRNLSELRDGQRAVITFSTVGCFHFNTFEFDISGSPPWNILVKQVWKDEVGKTQQKPIGAVKVSATDAKDLDLLFRFYASKPSGGCTTQDTIEVAVYSGSTLERHHSFQDDTCMARKLPGVLTIPEIIARLSGE